MAPRVLVIYGTTDGHTAKVAGALAGALRDAGLAVEVANAEGPWDPTPDDFSGVIVAASVHAGAYQKPVLRWVARHAQSLAKRPTAFVTVCLSVLSRTPKVDRDLGALMDRFFAMTEWQPTERKVVAGALLYTKYGWFKRWMMKRLVAKKGGDTDTSRDYEYTDWADLDQFAKRFALHLAPAKPVLVRSI